MVDLHHHGDVEVGPGMLDFAVNVLVPEPPAWLRLALSDRLAGLAAYPDTTPARDAVARHHGVDPRRVLLTNGAAEAFTLVARARAWRRPVVIHPQFTEPEAALVAAGRTVTRVLLDPEQGFALRPDLVPEEADLVVIGNPTNPTSVLHARSALEDLRRPGRVLVVDEAFLDVVGDPDGSTMLSAAGTGEDVVVIRSLTKAFGLAGLRVGYLVADGDLVRRCRSGQPPWPVSSLAAAAVEECLGPDGARHTAWLRGDLPEHTNRLIDTLTRHGFEVQPAAGPFVLARHPDALMVRNMLRDNGIAVRRGDTFPGLDDTWLRFAVRDQAAVAALDCQLQRIP